MASSDTSATPERAQTNESLRVERAKADDVIGDNPSAIDEAADAVINIARSRADLLLAAARSEVDRHSSAGTSPIMESPKVVARERAQEDRILREERATADEIVRSERAEHAAVLAMERDETDKDLSRERARSDDAVATRDEFLGIISHDLRNMLSSMIGAAELIESEATKEQRSERVLAYAQRIHRAGARMNRLIGDLVDLASIQAGSLAVTLEIGDPTPVVVEAVEAFQAQALATGITLSVAIAPPSTLVAFDAARILQVLVNLLSNAFKFTSAGGTVAIHVGLRDDELRFAVSDSGVGVPADKLEAIFERYVQVSKDRRGVGLGLYISRCIVQGHGGKIWAESTVGEGSTFWFTLPLKAPAGRLSTSSP